MTRLNELLIEFGKELISRPSTEQEKEGYRALISEVLMRDNAGIDLMKSAIRAMVNTRSNQDKGVTPSAAPSSHWTGA